MDRPICFDLTHLMARAGIPWPSGIDKVDLAYARHFTGQDAGPFLSYGVPSPHSITRARAASLVQRADTARWQADDPAGDSELQRVRRALSGVDDVSLSSPQATAHGPRRDWLAEVGSALKRIRLGPTVQSDPIPPRAIYLNVAQHMFERHEYFAWLAARPDVLPVFLIHDLLPLDYPELFRPPEAAFFERRVQMAFRYGRAFIVASTAVQQRVARELSCRGLPEVPTLVAPLPSSLGDFDPSSLTDPTLRREPYFVTLGTIEPRKNHLLLLSIWREMAEAGGGGRHAIPKLVIVGGRGWENEQVLDVLERGRSTRPHVIEASGLSAAGLARLVANARAVLMPSFAEGYGLPLVEALSLRTPVVTTDAPVFREVTQGCALYRRAIDGVGWEQAIRELADETSAVSREAGIAARRFRPPRWPAYFETVSGFLASL